MITCQQLSKFKAGGLSSSPNLRVEHREPSPVLQFDCSNRAIRSYNERLKELAAEYGMTYLDIYPLYEEGGELKKEMSKDGIHLYDKSCFAPWAELLRPYLEP